MSIGNQGEESPIKEEAILGVYLVDPSFCQVWTTDIEAHGEAINNHGSDLKGLALGTHQEGEGFLKASFDVEMGAFPCCAYPGEVIGFKVGLVEA